MVWQDGRPAVQLRLPLQPALARLGRDRGRLVPRLLVRCREHYGTAVGRLFRPQDLESADSARVATCAGFVPPPSGFPPPRLRQNNEDVLIPFPLPCLPGIGPSLTKYGSTAQLHNLINIIEYSDISDLLCYCLGVGIAAGVRRDFVVGEERRCAAAVLLSGAGH